jgi:uncharacterized protein GlcG (DUF336 family)
MKTTRFSALALATSISIVASCGGGGSGGSSSGGSAGTNYGCDGYCPNQALSSDDVTTILQQAVAAAKGLGTAGTFAVVDRVGNVLALYQMSGAPAMTTINGGLGASGGLEGLTVPATLAAISKAGTGAYLSSQGNAFSTRSASQIIQEHYLPGQSSQPGGPLFGVQFSQLACSDVIREGGTAGPHPLPLGLSADAGGFPLYKQGDLIGGIGVEFDGVYSLDRDPQDVVVDPEEQVALAASVGFEAPSERVGDTISVAGRSIRYSDISYSQLPPSGELEPLDPSGLKSLAGYTSAAVRAGTTFGTGESGIANTMRAGVPAAVLAGRFPTRAGRPLPGGVQLQGNEVNALLDSALLTANRTRAAIRNPKDTPARVSIFVVDDHGEPLGFVRSQDAPVFGCDVSLQKARSSAFMSSADAGAMLTAASGALGRDYASEYSRFTGRALDGSVAISARAIGNMSRPFTPDGIEGTPAGPFSLPYPGTTSGSTWSVFNTGLELGTVFSGVAASAFNPGSSPSVCGPLGSRLRNGLQIFAGGVPLYRNGVLIGAIGISGDGIDQDDMVAFYGASRRGLDYAGYQGVGDAVLGFNAPDAIRSDFLDLPEPQLRLRYVNCPEAPFIGTNEQGVCGDS